MQDCARKQLTSNHVNNVNIYVNNLKINLISFRQLDQIYLRN